jgi:small subunit ribosomal protein S1
MITNNHISDLVKAGKMLDPQLFSGTDIQAPNLYADNIKEGAIVEGRVKNITDYGVFIDLGGIDGLLHITDLSWERVDHPSEVTGLDEILTVKIIDFDEDKKRVSLGLKQLTSHPWENVEESYPEGTKISGKIVSMTNYGVFIEIEPGIEGLLHVSEMSWTRDWNALHPSEMFSLGDEIDAVVLAVDTEERKISLGAKQLQADPWDQIEEKYIVGTIVKGKIYNMKKFGAFMELEDGVDGLMHVSDLSWTKVITHPKEIFEIGQEVKVRVLKISVEDRRVSLGFKQMQDDPWPEIMKYFEIGKEVSGEIVRVIDKGVILNLGMNTEGLIPLLQIPEKKRKEVKAELKPNEKLSGLVTEVNSEDRKIILFNEKINQ